MEQTILVNLSNRHVHLTDEDTAVLFGPNHQLQIKTMLLQPGQFAAEETVTISVGERSIERVRVVGPTRSATQCEILTGDTYRLGLTPADVPVRMSGDIADSAGFTVTGPAGSVEKSEGLIIAQRHIHISPEDALVYNLEQGQTVSLDAKSPLKRTTLHDVIVRVQAGAALECHIDTEEGNAAGIKSGDEVLIQQ